MKKQLYRLLALCLVSCFHSFTLANTTCDSGLKTLEPQEGSLLQKLVETATQQARESEWRPVLMKPLVDELIDQAPQENSPATSNTLVHFVQWLDRHNGIENTMIRIHVRHWLETIGLKTWDQIEGYARLWENFSVSLKLAALTHLVQVIDGHSLTHLFSQPEKTSEDLKKAKSSDLGFELIMAFNQRWLDLNSDEKAIFLVAALADEMPVLLDSISPKQTFQENLSTVVKTTSVRLPSLSSSTRMAFFWRRFSKRMVQIDSNLVAAFSFRSEETVEAWVGRVKATIAQRTYFTFEEIEFLSTVLPPRFGSAERPKYERAHQFRSLTEHQCTYSDGGFSRYQYFQGGIRTGRMLTYTFMILSMIDKLDAVPNPEQYLWLMNVIKGGKEQFELNHRLRVKFPDSGF